MNKITQHYLKSVAETLNGGRSSFPLDKEQMEDLEIANRLLDYLIIDTSTAPQAAKDYLSAVHELLRNFEQSIASSSFDNPGGNIAKLEEFNQDSVVEYFETFRSHVTTLQSDLFKHGDPCTTELAHALMVCDSQYADTIFSAGLEMAKSAKDDQSGGAANVRNYDEKALRNFIVEKFPLETNIKIEKSGFISGGQSKFTLGLELSGTDNLPSKIILRGDGDGQFSGAGVAEEFRLQDILFNLGVNLPEPLALEQSGEVFGSPFMLSACAEGGCIGHMFKMPEKDEKLLSEIGQNLAKIHSIDPSVFGDAVDNANKPSSHKISQWLEVGYRDLQATGFSSSIFETAFTWLKENIALSDTAPRVLVHGDYGLNNILVKNSQVTAVLDWEFAHIGNPAYDLAYFYYQAQALGGWDLFLQSYANEGQPLPDQKQLDYCVLLANTRLGVQCVQVESAFNAGLISGPTVSRVIGNQYVNESILRISAALKRVL